MWALILVTLLVMILGVLVVLAPDQLGVPRPVPTPLASPAASESDSR